jgi:hypothetical protein
MSRAETCCVAQTKFLFDATNILNNATKSTLCNGDIARGELANTDFGISTSLSADGNTLAVGAPTYANGAVFIYKKQPAFGTNCGGKENPFVLHQLIEPIVIDGSGKIEFGLKVALSANGRRLIVAGRSDDFSIDVEDSGAVFVYDLKKCDQCFSFTQKLIAQKIDENGAIVNDAKAEERFGASIALSADGSVIAVANGTNSFFDGAVYVYVCNGNHIFVFSDKLQPTSTQVSNLAGKMIGLLSFGYSLSLNGNGSRLVVGAPASVILNPLAPTATGAALVFERNCNKKFNLVDVLIDQPKDITQTLIGLDVRITDDGKNLLVYLQDAFATIQASFVNVYTILGGTKHFSLTETLSVSGTGRKAAEFGNSVRQEYLTLANNACSFTVAFSRSNLVVVYRRRSVGQLFSEFEVIMPPFILEFGSATAMSRDGSRLVISANSEQNFELVIPYKSKKLFQ